MLRATVLGMVTAEPLTASRTLAANAANTPTALTAGFVDVLVEGWIDELIGELMVCVTLMGSDGVRAVRNGRKFKVITLVIQPMENHTALALQRFVKVVLEEFFA